MPELNPLTNEQIFLKKIAENTGSNYNTGDVSEINPLTIDQILLKEIAENTAGQSGDITELEGKVADNTSAIESTQDMISDTYDATATYAVGDYCIYNNVLYKCNTAIATPEAFTPAKWGATTAAREIKNNADKLTYIRIYPTINTSAIENHGYIRVYKMGCLVIISFGEALEANIAINTVLLSGLPIPIYENWFGSFVSQSQNLRVKVDNGALIAESATIASEWFSGNMVYITNA